MKISELQELLEMAKEDYGGCKYCYQARAISELL